MLDEDAALTQPQHRQLNERVSRSSTASSTKNTNARTGCAVVAECSAVGPPCNVDSPHGARFQPAITAGMFL